MAVGTLSYGGKMARLVVDGETIIAVQDGSPVNPRHLVKLLTAAGAVFDKFDVEFEMPDSIISSSIALKNGNSYRAIPEENLKLLAAAVKAGKPVPTSRKGDPFA